MARSTEAYPFFDKDADRITYDLWHGYSKFDRDGVKPRSAFGHGLPYTRFGYRAFRVRKGMALRDGEPGQMILSNGARKSLNKSGLVG